MRACYVILLCLLTTICPGCRPSSSGTVVLDNVKNQENSIDVAGAEELYGPLTDVKVWERLSKKKEQGCSNGLFHYGNSSPAGATLFLSQTEPENKNTYHGNDFLFGPERAYGGKGHFADEFLSTTIEAKAVSDNLLLPTGTAPYPAASLDAGIPSKEELLLLPTGRLDINVLIKRSRKIEQVKQQLTAQLQIAREDTQKHNRYLGVCLLIIALLFLLFILYQKRYRTALDDIQAELPGRDQEYTRLADEVQDEIDKGTTPVRLDPALLPDRDIENFATRPRKACTYSDRSDAVGYIETRKLHSSALLHFGLLKALTVWGRQFNTIGRTKVNLDFEGVFPHFPDLTVLHLYRITTNLAGKLREQLKDGEIRVRIAGDPTSLHIDISADNQIRAVEALLLNDRPDLDNIWERTRLLGGTVNIRRREDHSVLDICFAMVNLTGSLP